MTDIDLSQFKTQSDGVKDLYPTEKGAVKTIAAAMMRKHSFKGVTSIANEDQIKAAFSEEVRNRCNEIGLVAEVQWLWEDEETGRRSPDVGDREDDQNLYWNPRVCIVDRVHAESETDHDRYQHEVRAGLDGGTPGYIREDGTHHDEPIKKTIY